MIVDPCVDQNTGRRRIFWTTQESCGTFYNCGSECSLPGLKYVDSPEGRTISNDAWLRGLILNILNTRARTNVPCPNPVAVFGHWSDSYRGDGLKVGSTVYDAAEKSYYKITDAVKAIGAAIKADMAKLVILNVADTVEVETVYMGGNRVAVEIIAVVRNVRHSLNLSGTYASDTWVWH